METTGDLLNQWRKKYTRANRIHEVIPLPEAKIQDLVLTYGLICNYGWYYRSYFVIASRNADMVATANAVNECGFIGQVPYWARDIETREISQLPSELERAIASFYPKKKIPPEIRDKIMLHCETISKVIDYCGKNQTDDLPNTEGNAKFL